MNTSGKFPRGALFRLPAIGLHATDYLAEEGREEVQFFFRQRTVMTSSMSASPIRTFPPTRHTRGTSTERHPAADLQQHRNVLSPRRTQR